MVTVSFDLAKKISGRLQAIFVYLAMTRLSVKLEAA